MAKCRQSLLYFLPYLFIVDWHDATPSVLDAEAAIVTAVLVDE